MRKINILQLSTGLGVGGAEKVILELSKSINNQKFDNKVIGLSNSLGLNYRFKEEEIKTTILNEKKSLVGFKNMISFVNKFVKDNKIDIIHAHMTHAMFVAVAVKLFNPHIKIVFTSHSVNVGSKFREMAIFLLKPFRNADIIFSKEQLGAKYKSNYFIIANGIDTKAYQLNCKKSKKFTFLAIGSLREPKNHIHLIQCAALLRNKFQFQILIVGEGPLRNTLEEAIEKYQIQSYIKLLGLRSDIPELLNTSHCFVMPSLWEGMPISILEAGAANLPIISTPAGSIPSVLNKENAFLANLNNFHTKMKYVLTHYYVALRKAKKLEKRVFENYDIKAMYKKHEELYILLLNNKV